MQPNEPSQPAIVASKAGHPHLKYWLSIAALLVISAAACYGIYSWQHHKVEQLSARATSAQAGNNSSSSQSSPAKNGSASTYSTNVAAGYPLSLPKKKVLITLYLPAGNSILQEELGARTQDELASNYTESENDVLANWIFNNNGTDSNPSDSLSSNQNITVTALNNWMNAPDSAGVSYPTLGVQTTGPMTASQKASFVASLKSQTAACAADASKGFATNDKVFNICITLQHPQGEGGNWIMDLSGYANINGTSAYLRGFIDLPFTGYQAVESQYIQALKNTSTVVQDNNQ